MGAIKFERTEVDNSRVSTPIENEWSSNDFWPVPLWFKNKELTDELKDYQSYLKYNLRTRYIENQEDFRTAFNNFSTYAGFDIVTASRIVELLCISRKALEEENANLLDIANLLDLVERYLIWLFPHHIVNNRINILAKRINLTNHEYAAHLTEKLKIYNNPAHIGELRAVYDEVIGDLNRINTKKQISFGLQIERLSILRYWGIIVLIFSIFILPISLNIKETGFMNSVELFIFPSINLTIFSGSENWIVVFIFAVMGGIGGFMSGLLQVKDTNVNLIEFKESLLKFYLKPIIGAILAIIVSVLLSWKILPGVKIDSIGTFFLIAFLTGFSERYFLKLLKIDSESLNIEQLKPMRPASLDLPVLTESPKNQDNTR